MIVTVCELPDDRKGFEHSWSQLAEHVKQARSGLVLLPDMAFSPWFAESAAVDPARWQRCPGRARCLGARLGELGAALVLGSRPIDFGNERYDEGFVWTADTGIRSVHAQATHDFVPLEVDGVDIGFMIGSEVCGARRTALRSRRSRHRRDAALHARRDIRAATRAVHAQ